RKKAAPRFCVAPPPSTCDGDAVRRSRRGTEWPTVRTPASALSTKGGRRKAGGQTNKPRRDLALHVLVPGQTTACGRPDPAGGHRPASYRDGGADHLNDSRRPE